MKKFRLSWHALLVALVLIAALFAFSNVYGQKTDAGAVFQGRPQMSGAQGGLGAQAGPPQGGVGVQGSDAAAPVLRHTLPQEPPAARTVPPPPNVQDLPRDPGDERAPRRQDDAKPRQDSGVTPQRDRGIKPKQDPGVARERRSMPRKTERAIRRSTERARHGVSPLDSDKP